MEKLDKPDQDDEKILELMKKRAEQTHALKKLLVRLEESNKKRIKG